MSTDKEEVEIFTVVKLPRGHYQVATGLTRIYNHANFDEYVSETIRENVESLLDGKEPLDDHISRNLTGKPSLYIRQLKKQFGPINKRLKQMAKEERRMITTNEHNKRLCTKGYHSQAKASKPKSLRSSVVYRSAKRI